MRNFQLQMANTYRQNGFFNVGVGSQQWITPTDGPMDLYLGDATVPVGGRVTRRANQNATPRVFGNKPLAAFFQAHYALGDSFDVEILTPTSMRIGAGRFSAGESRSVPAPTDTSRDDVGMVAPDFIAEDDVKRTLQKWLEASGWAVKVVFGKGRGIDIEATRGPRRWVIEAKGQGSLSAMRVNFFLGALGELLQRMSDPQARYSIAMPDLPQYRRLWERVPRLAKERTGVSALFVTRRDVEEIA